VVLTASCPARPLKAAHGSSVSLWIAASLAPRRSKMRAKLGAPPLRKSAAIAVGMVSETFAAAALSLRSKASRPLSAIS
jgi:hypothetical protein